MGVFIVGRPGETRDQLAAAARRGTVRVSLFDTVEAAEAALEAERPCLVVLADAGEPDLLFCRRLRRGPLQEAVVVLVAVSGEAQDRLAEALAAGADDYLVLPAPAAQLEARVALAIRRAEEKARRVAVDRQLAARARQQSLVAELGQRALSGVTLHEASELAVRMLADALGVELARVLAYDPAEGTLRMTAGVGWREGEAGRFTIAADPRWAAGYTLLSAEPVVTSGDGAAQPFEMSAILLEHGVVSSIAVAIPGEDRPYGVLGAYSRTRRLFDQDDISFLQSVANVLAAVAERARRSATLGCTEARAQRLATVASRTINGVIITDVRRRIEWVNEGFTRITGYTLEEVRGKVPGRFLQGPDTDPETVAYIRRQLSRNEGFTTEIVNYRKSGERYWVRIEVQPLFDGEELSGYMAIETDETEQRLAEQALRESEARVRAILETTVEAIITIDVQGLVESFNSAAERIFGYRAAEVIGHNVKLLMPTPYFEEHDGYLASYLETGRRQIIGIGREVVGLRKDGTQFPMELAVSEVRLGDRVIFTGIIRDITERRRLEQEILETSEQERRRIGQDLHDGLGQMLTGISLISKNLERRLRAAGVPEAEIAAEITELMKEADQHARGLARGLVPVELEGNGLSAALQQLAADAERYFAIQCTFEEVGSPQLHDNTAATHLYRIAQEAVSNAVKHGRATRVGVTLAAGEDRVRLRIQDNGSGFPEVMGEAQGMGVRIMHYRARIIGGSLDIRDDPAGGTVVTCTLRRSPAAGSSVPLSSKKPVTSP